MYFVNYEMCGYLLFYLTAENEIKAFFSWLLHVKLRPKLKWVKLTFILEIITCLKEKLDHFPYM